MIIWWIRSLKIKYTYKFFALISEDLANTKWQVFRHVAAKLINYNENKRMICILTLTNDHYILSNLSITNLYSIAQTWTGFKEKKMMITNTRWTIINKWQDTDQCHTVICFWLSETWTCENGKIRWTSFFLLIFLQFH